MADKWPNYEYQPSFILGFHGCKKAVGQAIINGGDQHLLWSRKPFDWLGHGIYFWEGDPARAWEWAIAKQKDGRIDDPFVIGAIIDLRYCLDLFGQEALNQVKGAHVAFKRAARESGVALPKNVGSTPDKAGRMLDCAVLNSLHAYRQKNGLKSYDSVRAPFLEGTHLYRNAGFRSHNHIQIAVRNVECIKGYFLPIRST